MPILLISALLLAGLGYWEYTRLKAGLPIFPSLSSGIAASPEQVVKKDAPLLSKEILDLYYNGRDPMAMHRAANELEKYGFFDAAMLLHKRAEQIAILNQRVDATLANQGINPATATPTMRATAEAQITMTESTAQSSQATAAQVNAQAAAIQAANAKAEADKAAAEAAASKAAAEQAAREAAAREAGRQQALAEQAAREAGLRRPLNAPIASGTRGTVNLQGQPLAVYQSPSFTAQRIGEIPPGGTVEISSVTDQFYLIKYQGLTGWVNKSYISLGAGISGSRPAGIRASSL